MRSKDFMGWMEADGLDKTTARSRLANCRAIEKYQHVNLDEKYDLDRCEHLITLFTYTTDDERTGKEPRHQVPIKGNVRNGSATYKATIRMYVKFRDSENGVVVTPCRPEPRRVPHVRKGIKKNAVKPNRESYSEFFETFGIMPQAICDFGLENSVFAEPDVAWEQWERLKKALFDDLLYIRARGIGDQDREFQFYKRLHTYLFENGRLERDPNGNHHPRQNLQRAVGWVVTIHPKEDTGVLVNFQTSHVLSGRTHNPLLYSAVWNIVFTPKIIDPLTGDEAHGEVAKLFREVFLKKIHTRFAKCIEDYNRFIDEQKILSRINDFHDEFFKNDELARLKENARNQWAVV